MEVAVASPPFRSYHYIWPERFGEPQTGLRVRVPFGRGVRWGVVLGEGTPPVEVELKPILDVLDAAPLLDAARQRWLARVGRYWLAPPAQLWQAALSWAQCLDARAFIVRDRKRLQAWDAELGAAFARTPKRVLAGLWRAGMPDAAWRVQRALAEGLLEEVAHDPPALPDPLPAPEALTDEQEKALARIMNALGGFRMFALVGPTGSGKTAVYLAAAKEVARRGRQTLVLLPEIALAPQWLARARGVLGDAIAPWHSGLDARARLGVLARIEELALLVGARSALFAPLPRLGLIVVDEEHDPALKQQEAPAIHAREAAMLLGETLGIPVVLGSATPSAEVLRLVEEGRAESLRLSRRFAAHPKPRVEIVDMRGVVGPISDALVEALREVKEEGAQALLFLNRRAWAPALQCRACGETPACPHCTCTLALHRRARALRCHLCGYSMPAPSVCPACGEEALAPLGAGSERLEEELRAHLPDLRVARLDRDVITSHGRLARLLARFARGELDALVGTQMLVQGHHFPEVALVAVVNAELGLGVPDFRAAERWWQQITQVMGRTGRGARPGRVLVQTRRPDAPWIQALGVRDYLEVMREELAARKALGFPPYARAVRVVFAARKREEAERAAVCFARAARRTLPDPVRITGPQPCPRERVQGRWRFEVLLRDPSRRVLPWQLAPLLDDEGCRALARPPGVAATVQRHVDVDPVDWM